MLLSFIMYIVIIVIAIVVFLFVIFLLFINSQTVVLHLPVIVTIYSKSTSNPPTQIMLGLIIMTINIET